MASTWSALKVELLETGANAGSWGTLTNANLGDAILGEAITGQATVDFSSDADVTITLTDSATSQSARNLRLNITESSTGIGSVRNLILGSGCQIEKFYLINNTGTGAKTIKNTSGTGISVPAGKATLVYNNGTNVVDAASYFSSLTLGSALPVASGGTGITSFGTGVATALGVNTGSAGAFVVNGGALGSPSSAGTIPAFTLGGTVSGGGNQINNVIIGTTTPLAGAFTTVDASGSVTLSGGTANGVTYLNGSKVLTSGSALSFDGNTVRNNQSSGTNSYFRTTSGTVDVYYGAATSGLSAGAVIGTFSNNDVVLYQNSAEGMRLGSSGLSIGTSTVNYGLTVQKDNGSGYIAAFRASAGNPYITLQTTSGITQIQGINSAFTDVNNIAMQLSGGNVGIGTSSPAAKLHIFSANSVSSRVETSGAGSAASQFKSPSGSTFLGQDATGGYLLTDYAAPILFYTNNTERARIDSSGNLLINSTSTLNAVFSVTATSGISACSLRVATDGDYGYTFKNASNTFVGAIGVNSSSTSYVTSSDYRLKNTIAPMTGALAKVALLKPVTYKWNVDGSDSQGFIAHELAEVVPECVTGEKDAIDAEGNPIYQGIDTSFLVATLTSAIQEQQALIQSLKARLDAANL